MIKKNLTFVERAMNSAEIPVDELVEIGFRK